MHVGEVPILLVQLAHRPLAFAQLALALRSGAEGIRQDSMRDGHIRSVMGIHLLLDRVGRLLTRHHLHPDLRQLDATPLERAMRHVDLLPKVIQLQIRRRLLGPYRKHLPRETYPALHISTVRRGGDGASARHTPRARIQTHFARHLGEISREISARSRLYPPAPRLRAARPTRRQTARP